MKLLSLYLLVCLSIPSDPAQVKYSVSAIFCCLFSLLICMQWPSKNRPHTVKYSLSSYCHQLLLLLCFLEFSFSRNSPGGSWSAVGAFRLLLSGGDSSNHGCSFVHWTAIWAKSGQLTLTPPVRSSE